MSDDPKTAVQLPPTIQPSPAASAATSVAPATLSKADAQERPERFKVKVADEKFTGNIAGVKFKRGIGYTNDPHQQHTCKQFGALVVDSKSTVNEADED